MWRSLTSHEIFLLPSMKPEGSLLCSREDTNRPSPESAESSPHQILILPVVDLSLHDFQLKCCRHFSQLRVLHDLPNLLIPLIVLCSYLHPLATTSILVSNNALNLYFLLWRIAQVTHPYKQQLKLLFHILIFVFLDTRRDDTPFLLSCLRRIQVTN